MNPLFSINTGWEISALLFFHLIQSNRVYPSPPTISVYIRRRRGKETKNLFFFFSEWFQMKSDCSTRTVYLITSFDESNSFKLKTKKKEWPTVFLIFQLLCSYSSLAKASSSKAHERLPNSLDNTLLWTMNNIFFLFSFFLSALTCFPASSILLRFHFYCYYYYYRWCYYYCLLGFSLSIAKLLLFHRHSQTRTIIKCPIWPSGNQLDADRESSFDQKNKNKNGFSF